MDVHVWHCDIRSGLASIKCVIARPVPVLICGLVPTATHSWNWLENAEFRDAVDRFLERETDAITHYMDEMEGPFRREPPLSPAHSE